MTDSQFNLRCGLPGKQAPLPIECGVIGSVVKNVGPKPVYYRDEQPVSATANDGTIVAGGSASLYGTQYFVVDQGDSSSAADTAQLSVEVRVPDTGSEALDAEGLSKRTYDDDGGWEARGATAGIRVWVGPVEAPDPPEFVDGDLRLFTNDTSVPAHTHSGLLSRKVPVTGAYTALAGDIVEADATSAGFTVTLPAATIGGRVLVKKTDSSAHVVTVSASDGATVRLTAANQGVVVIADGVSWRREVRPGIADLADWPSYFSDSTPGTATWTSPVTGRVRVQLTGPGNGGGGGGANTTTALQSGGGGGGSGAVYSGFVSLTAGDVVTYTILDGNAGGAGGAASGNNGGTQASSPSSGSATGWSTSASGSFGTLYATGGGGGQGATVGTTNPNGGAHGRNSSGSASPPGYGGAGNSSASPIPPGVVGGGGGGAASVSAGGTGGAAATGPGALAMVAGTAGGSGTTSGTNGTAATEPGCGGGGGGGGNSGGSGGNGGKGGPGKFEVWY